MKMSAHVLKKKLNESKELKNRLHNMVCVFQAERLMEALDLYKEESAKLKDHKEQCQRKGQQVFS